MQKNHQQFLFVMTRLLDAKQNAAVYNEGEYELFVLLLCFLKGKTMVQTFEALFDGVALHPDTLLPLEANTRVRVTIETLPAEKQCPRSFLRTAHTLILEGPADWSANLDQYLYREDNEPTG